MTDHNQNIPLRGHRASHEHPNFPRQDWQLEYQNGDTRLAYWDWVSKVREETRSLRHHAGA